MWAGKCSQLFEWMLCLRIYDFDPDAIEYSEDAIALLVRNQTLPFVSQNNVHYFQSPDGGASSLSETSFSAKAVSKILLFKSPSERRAGINDNHDKSVRASWTDRTICSVLSLGNTWRNWRSS